MALVVLSVVEQSLDAVHAVLERTELVRQPVHPAEALVLSWAAIDRLVWYAGWADRLAQVTGGANSVAGPYFNHTAPEPSGVIAVVAPSGPLLGLVSVVAPVIVTGNTAVVIASEPHPLTSITLAEVMATSDVPGGVLTGVGDADLARNLEIDAAENLKRVRRPGLEDLLAPPPLDRMTTFQ